ncbi:MAG: class I SAM-dependent methyltransferase [Draconibacterium sp.]|nr:class I SAM-dependent methyltransferase [Draconibacterium sp.]
MNDFWNQRYKTKEYAYGELPNLYFKKELEKLIPGIILLPGEGEGRNAVFAASKGWDVTAFDPSTEGRKKALLLAENHNVKINYLIESYETADFNKDSFDCIGLIYTHMSLEKRKEYHRKLLSFLNPGGILILEGFSKQQINKNTGGPRNIEMLFSKDELLDDFSGLKDIKIEERDTRLNEGSFHQGVASVIRLVGTK